MKITIKIGAILNYSTISKMKDLVSLMKETEFSQLQLLKIKNLKMKRIV
jgi:hypothetical protein